MFNVTFKKRSGKQELRQMSCRLGVKKFLNPEARPRNFTPANHNLISVAENVPVNHGTDGDNMQYRAISIEGIRRLAIDGEVFTVVDEHIAAMSS
jgi:hypothetical protein